MTSRRAGLTKAATTLCATALLAACGTTSGGNSASGQPTPGGTLKLLGSSDVDHLDTASAYYTSSYTLERAYARQLFSYPASTDVNTAITPVPDLATQLPTKQNGGISADGKTYTIHVRAGAKWNTTPAREVTAQDVVLGLKRLCNPASPVGAPGYYENTIVGMKAYCDGFAKVSGTATAIAAYINGHEMAGVRATDARTVVFRLTQPTSDFLNLLAMPFASPAPREYLKYVPDDATFRQHTISDGPYQITKYVPNQDIELIRNPPGTRAPTRSGTSTSTTSRSPRARTPVRCSSRSRPAPPTCNGTRSCRPPTFRLCRRPRTPASACIRRWTRTRSWCSTYRARRTAAPSPRSRCARPTRVQNAIFLPFSQAYDITQVWLNPTS
jgi:ABC-type transport system substrate-binding protein